MPTNAKSRTRAENAATEVHSFCVQAPSFELKSSLAVQCGFSESNAIAMPAIEPPAIYPDDRSTPGLISDSAALFWVHESAIQRTKPPTKMGVEEDRGR